MKKIKFRTGAVCFKKELKSKSLIKGKNFDFKFELSKEYNLGYNDFELIIISSNKETAQQAYELFIAALTLIQSHVVYPITEMPSILSYELDELKSEIRPWGKNICMYMQEGIYSAAIIAAKASFRKKHKIAVLKYLFACSQHSNYLVQIDPFRSRYEKLSIKSFRPYKI